MCASPFRLLRAGPPPPKVALLPDALFFTRSVPVAKGATPAEAGAQVELALESASPFPLAQLYFGWFWTPGAENALVFASYRRRFTTEQAAAWAGAELVLPAFGALLGAEVEPATTILLQAPDGLTAVHWENPPVPSKVRFLPLPPESTDEERIAAREALLREMGGSRQVIELDAMPAADAATSDREMVFRAGDFVSRLPAGRTSALDVRDKGELAALRVARKRDVVLWRVMLGCAAALVLLTLGEFALVGGRMWNDVRLAKVRGQKSTVDKIMASQSLATRIEELATKRLLPFEMITELYDQNRKPPEITFTRVVTLPQTGKYTLTVDATSTNVGLVSVYETTLRALPTIERVDVRDFRTRGETATFTLVVTFKPDTLKPADSISQ